MSQILMPAIESVTSSGPHIRISLRKSAFREISLLDEETEDFYSQLCYHHKPGFPWVLLPPHLQEEIDSKQRCHEIAYLKIKGLIDVEVCG